MRFQSSFMSATTHLLIAAASRALSRRPKGVPVVGVFAYRIGMMDKQAKAGASRNRRPLQHFEIAVGIAECRDRTAADELIDADRLASLVVDEIEFRQTEKLGSAANAESSTRRLTPEK
jgi:hypothetical protein